MIPMDGEGDGGSELHAATKGKRESARGGGYHQSSVVWRPPVHENGKAR
jgi:hypothetical protein